MLGLPFWDIGGRVRLLSYYLLSKVILYYFTNETIHYFIHNKRKSKENFYIQLERSQTKRSHRTYLPVFGVSETIHLPPLRFPQKSRTGL